MHEEEKNDIDSRKGGDTESELERVVRLRIGRERQRGRGREREGQGEREREARVSSRLTRPSSDGCRQPGRCGSTR